MSVSSPSGGDGSYTYQWQVSTDKINWSDTPGATSSTYTPGALSATTYYRRATLQALLSLQAVDDDGNSIKVSSKPTVTDEQFKIALEKIQNGKYTIEKLKENYSLTKEQEAQL
jgi:hypothetical protein